MKLCQFAILSILNISTCSHVNVPETNMVIDEGPHMNHAQAAFLRQLVNHGIRSDDGIHDRKPYQHKLINIVNININYISIIKQIDK